MDREVTAITSRGEATRGLLIEVARDLLAERGYGLVSKRRSSSGADAR